MSLTSILIFDLDQVTNQGEGVLLTMSDSSIWLVVPLQNIDR